MPLPKLDEWLLKKTADIIDEIVDDEQLKRVYAECRIQEAEGRPKRQQIFCSLHTRQIQDGYANNVVWFIRRCLDSVRSRRGGPQFAKSRCRLNGILAYAALQVGEDGEVRVVHTEESKELAQNRRSEIEAVRRLCGDEVEARLWKKLMRDKSYGTERFDADVLINRFRHTPRPSLKEDHVKRAILWAAEREDHKFFKRLGKALTAKPKLPSGRVLAWQASQLRPWVMSSLPPLVVFLLTRWTKGVDNLPPLCFLTPMSLTNVCSHYLGSELSDYQVSKVRQRLGLKHLKRHQVEVIEVGDQLKVV